MPIKLFDALAIYSDYLAGFTWALLGSPGPVAALASDAPQDVPKLACQAAEMLGVFHARQNLPPLTAKAIAARVRELLDVQHEP